MNIMNSLTLRSLKLNRKRTVVTIVGIILSGALICGVATIAASFQDLFVQMAIETDGNYHATFYDVSNENSAYITENPYTAAFMLSRDAGYALLEESYNGEKPYLFVKEYDDTAFTNMPVKLTEGRFPEKRGEMVISEALSKSDEEAYCIGKTVSLTTGRRFDRDGVNLSQHHPYSEDEVFEPLARRTYTITGIIAKPRFEPFHAPGHTVIAYLEHSNLAAAEAVNISILGQNPRAIYDRAPEMALSAGAGHISYNNEILRWLGASQNNAYYNLLWSVALIVILLVVAGSVAVIYNAFAISVSERKKQFGMLSSVGSTPRQIRKTVFFEGVILGLIGMPGGILAGIAGMGVTLAVVNRLMVIGSAYSDTVALRLVVSPLTILATVFFLALVIFLSAYIPAKKAAHISPIDAIRSGTDISLESKRLKTSRITRQFFGIEGELALKNLKRNRRRYRATVFSLFISIVLYVSFSSFITYSTRSSDIYHGEDSFDLAVYIYDLTTEELKEFYDRISALEHVDRCAWVRTLAANAGNLDRSHFGSYIRKHYIDQGIFTQNEEGGYTATFIITTPGDQEFAAYAEENGLDPRAFLDTVNYKGILVNINTVQENGRYIEYEPVNIKKGEILQLSVRLPGGETAIAGLEMEISAVTGSYPLGVPTTIPYRGFNVVVIVVSEPVFEKIISSLDENIPGHNVFSPLYIQSGNPSELAGEIRYLAPNESLYLDDTSLTAESMRRTRLVVSIFLYGFVILITLIGVTNIFNTISTNVALRRREFAMFKSVGLTPRGFNKMINYESIFYGLKALLYGLPAGILVSIWLYNSFGHAFQFAFTLPWTEIAVCSVAVLAIVSATMLHASARLKNENIIDALKEENL